MDAQPTPSPIAAQVGCALAVTAALCFSIASASSWLPLGAEELFLFSWLVGWVLLLWALLIVAGHVLLLARYLFTRAPVARDMALWSAAALVSCLAVAAANPLWGSGSGYGS